MQPAGGSRLKGELHVRRPNPPSNSRNEQGNFGYYCWRQRRASPIGRCFVKNADHGVSATVGAEHLDQNSPTFKLMPTLVLSIGILVLLSVGSVLIVNWIVDRRIVQEFTSRLITRVLSAEERSLREHLDAAIDQGNFIAVAISSGRYQLAEPALADFVSGTLAAAPKVDGVVRRKNNRNDGCQYTSEHTHRNVNPRSRWSACRVLCFLTRGSAVYFCCSAGFGGLGLHMG